MKINIVTFLFVVSIILKFGSYSEIFAFIVGVITVYYLATINNSEYSSLKKIMKNNLLIVFAYVSSLLSTIINSIFNNRIGLNYILEIVLFGLITLLGILLYNKEGKKYIQEGIFQIIFILFFFSFIGVVEFFVKENFFYRFVPDLREEYFWNTGSKYRISTVFIHPIPCANIYMFGLLSSYFLLPKNKYRLLCISMFVLIILFTQTRSAWLALILWAIWYYISKFSMDIRKICISSLKVIAIGLFFFFFLSQISFINEIINQRISNTSDSLNEDYTRIASIIYILNLFIHSNIFHIVFGHGGHACSFAIEQVDLGWKDWNTTDNLYLSDLYNFGIFFSLVTMYLSIILLKQLRKNKRNKRIKNAILSILLAFEVMFFFYEPFVHYSVALIFFLSLGFFFSVENRKESQIYIKLSQTEKQRLWYFLKKLNQSKTINGCDNRIQ